jgi:hypothetical protein
MENIAVVIQKNTRQVVYATSNSAILPKTEELDRYLADPRYQVIIDVQTAVQGRVRMVGEQGQIVEMPLTSLNPNIYRGNLGWSMEMFSRGADISRQIQAVIGMHVNPRSEGSARLELTTDAPDISPYNGIPEIPADGHSTATIFIRKKSPSGEPLTGDEDNDLIVLHTTRGTLSHRQVRLHHGQAQVTLRSSTDTIIADVTAQGENLRRYMLHLEFAPPMET